jgi:hypothetical protein
MTLMDHEGAISNEELVEMAVGACKRATFLNDVAAALKIREGLENKENSKCTSDDKSS